MNLRAGSLFWLALQALLPLPAPAGEDAGDAALERRAIGPPPGTRSDYEVRSYPTSFLIDRDGRIVEREVGFGPGSAASREEKIRRLLESSPPRETRR